MRVRLLFIMQQLYYSMIHKQSNFIPSYKWDYSYIKRIYNYKSFINPNARCPICDARVYFYQSPYGGKVFFDELGPPWSKHGCITSSKDPVKAKGTDTTSMFQPKWVRFNWKPFICKTSESSSNLQEITLICEKEIVICYGLSKNVKIKSGSLVYLRNINHTYLEASLLLNNNIPKTFILLTQKSKEEDLMEELDDFTIMEKYILPITPYRKYNKPCNTIDKSYYKNLISDETTSSLILTYIFFRFFNDRTMVNKVIKHPESIKSGMSDIFSYIIKKGMKKFMDNLYKEYKYYDDEIISILRSVTNVPLANGIQKIIQKKDMLMNDNWIGSSFEDKGWSIK